MLFFVKDQQRDDQQKGAVRETYLDHVRADDKPLRGAQVAQSFSPIGDSKGDFLGTCVIVHDRTSQIIAERRLKLTLTLTNELALATTTDGFFEHACQALSTCPFDLPFLVAYTGRLDMKGSATEFPRLHLHRVDSVGVADDHIAFPPVIALECQNTVASPNALARSLMHFVELEATPWPLALALSSDKPAMVEDLGDMVLGVDSRGWSNAAYVKCFPCSACSE